MQANLLLVFFFIIIIFILLIGRLFFLNQKNGKRYEKRVLSQQTHRSASIPYQRGTILDCKGTVLARSEKVYHLILDPKQVWQQENSVDLVIQLLAECFQIKEEEIRNILAEKKDRQYVLLRKEVSVASVKQYQKQVKKIEKQNEKKKEQEKQKVQGVWFEEAYVRRYPLKTVASQLIGFTTKAEGNIDTGNWGLEQYYNTELNGTSGMKFTYFNESHQLQRDIREPVNGHQIVSTIDANIQSIIEKEINRYNKKVRCDNTAVLLMNPNNGEVIAMASYPQYDLNHPRDLKKFFTKAQRKKMSSKKKQEVLNRIWRNFCISDGYEPGSTFKPFTVAAGLEEGVLTGNERFTCNGYEMVAGTRINCNKHVGHGNISLQEALMESCNVALMNIGKREGRNRFEKYLQLFGFGKKTQIDLPGEASGLILNEKQLNPVELATSSFGQSNTVTMIQMASAFSSLINGGYYYQPHMVKKILDADGTELVEKEPQLLKKTVSKKTVALLKQYLYQTVEKGTAQKAAVAGYEIGGKTGTAQKRPIRAGKHLLSFIGFAPISKPQVLLYVVVDNPNVAVQESRIATEMASRIFKKIFPFLEVYPTRQASKKAHNT